jgi:uncharacterized protein
MMTLSPRVTLIIKVTNACDMKCRYCFIEPSVYHKTMNPETAERVVDAFLASDFFESVHFVWHGGEPLLRGREFFQRIFEQQRDAQTKVRFTNSTQTNATHLDDEMLDFLIDNDVSVGLSLDGPERLNDASRKPRSAAGAAPSAPRAARLSEGRARRMRAAAPYATTVAAAAALRMRGREAGAIVTVNRNNVAEPEAIYQEYSRRGIHMKINPLTRSGLADVTLGDDLGISAEEYGRFLVRLFDAWFDDLERTISIEPFGQHIARILGDQVTHSCFYTLSCHHFFLGISPDGDLFPCGMFQGEPEFKYGNIHELTPEEVAQTALFGQIEDRERNVLKTCSRCAFFDLCYGGCMFHSLKDSKIVAEKDYYCAGYKIYFEHVLRRIHGDVALAMRVAHLSRFR